MKLSHLAHRLLTVPYIDWSEMPDELQSQRPRLGPGAVRFPVRVALPSAFGVCQLQHEAVTP